MATELSRLHPGAALSEAGEAWVDGWLGTLTPEQKAAQCVVVLPGVNPDGSPDDATVAALKGGLGTLHSVTDLTASAAARYHAAVGAVSADAGLPPVFVAGNLEAGIGYSLGATGTDFPYPRGIGMAGSPELAYRVALAAAQEAHALGYRWTLSPCIDVVTTADDPILGVRAYGVDAASTSTLGAAQIRGYQDAGVLASAKHFPGHGDSAVDSHLDLPRIDRTRHAHETVHLAPFRAAVDAGVASIMVAHMVLPELGIDQAASLSGEVNRGWLREQLGYQGVIITDSLRMKAIAARHDPGSAAVLAVRAGADVANVKCPASEFPAVMSTLAEALAAGDITEAMLDAAVRRLLAARWRAGADRPFEYDEPTARRYDAPLEWDDELRRTTVSVRSDSTPSSGMSDESYLVVGDSPLARRTAELLRERGLDATEVEAHPSADTLATAVEEADRAGAALLPVFCPSLPMTGDERRAIVAATAPEQVRARVRAVLVNTAADAGDLPETGTAMIAIPAVDAFDMVTDAAVRAAIDALP